MLPHCQLAELSNNRDGKRKGCIKPGGEMEGAGEGVEDEPGEGGGKEGAATGEEVDPGAGGGLEKSFRQKGHPVTQVFDANIIMNS